MVAPINNYPLRYLIGGLWILLLAFFLYFCSLSFVDSLINFFGIGFILLYLTCKKRKDYFDPIYLFSLYFLFVYVAAISISIKGFDSNLFLSSTHFYYDLNFLYTVSLLVSFVSYLSVFLGYYLIFNRRPISAPLKVSGINSCIFVFIAVMFYIVGFSNFIYNVVVMYSGNFINYYINISTRYIDFAEGGTTLGYHFLYAGSYMLYIRMLQLKKNVLLTYFLVFLSILVFASSGRITNSIIYLASFLMIYYYNCGYLNLNKRFFLVGLSVALLGVLFYALRYASSLYYNDMYDFSEVGVIDFIADFFSFENLTVFLIDNGNLPNFAILMKVVDSWGHDIGYMFGSTLFFPFYGFISNDLFGLIPMPAVTTKNVWYSHIFGGNLPVTGMGEMVLNFSLIGFPIGMFLFGAMGALFRNIFLITRSNIYLIFYTKFCFFFLFYPKGEFNNFDLFWMSFPSLLFLFSIYFARALSPKYKVNVSVG